ncbi:MAG: hypothetical protein K8W52_12760 [Deltaproteobacteria bacterium]|nr:hypothetical protein [Deltaproteobacteria bacterium]
MRTRWSLGKVVIVLSLGACTSHPELHLDVVRSGSIRVLAYELARPDACAPRLWTEPGETDHATDVIPCDTDDPSTPTAWIEDVTVERGGQVLGRATYDAWSGAIVLGDFAGQRDLVVRISGDGDGTAIALPDAEPPVTTIDALTTGQDSLTVAWHAAPAGATAIVVLEYRNGGVAMHQPAETPAVFYVPSVAGPSQFQPTAVSAHAFASHTVATELGQAHVWTGGTVARQDLPVQ